MNRIRRFPGLALALLLSAVGPAGLRAAPVKSFSVATLSFDRSLYQVAEAAGDLRVVLVVAAPACSPGGFEVVESTVTLTTAENGSAHSGSDFRPLVETFRLGGSVSRLPILLPGLVIDDRIAEGPETFLLKLQLHAASGSPRVRCSDGDILPLVASGPATVEIDDDGGGISAPQPRYEVRCLPPCGRRGGPDDRVDALEVQVVDHTDPSGRSVDHVPVYWTASGMPLDFASAVTLTDGQGVARKEVTLGPKVGAAVVVASIRSGAKAAFQLQIEESPPPEGAAPLPGRDLCQHPEQLPRKLREQCALRPPGPPPDDWLPRGVASQTTLGREGLGLQGRLVRGRLGSQGDAATRSRGTQVYASAGTSSGGRPSSESEAGYDYSLRNLAAGVDGMATPRLLLGGAVGYLDGRAENQGGGGSLDLRALCFSAYAAYQGGGGAYHLIGIFTWGRPRFASERVVALPEEEVLRARSSSHGALWDLSLEGGGTAHFGRLSLAGHGDLRWSQAEIGPYGEHGADDFNLVIDGLRRRWLVAGAGARMQYTWVIGTSSWVLYAGGSALHQLAVDNPPVVWRFAQGEHPEQTFALTIDRPDRDYFELEAGLSARLPGSWRPYVSFRKEVEREDLASRSLLFGVLFKL